MSFESQPATTTQVKAEDGLLVFPCPHCEQVVVVNVRETNCCIFRHAALKSDATKQIDPHTPKEECDRLVLEDLVYGCAKPFQLVKQADNESFVVQECGYI